MTKEVLLNISGLHYENFPGEDSEDQDPIEVITPAVYYLKNGKHYVLYDEVVEGVSGTVRNQIRIKDDLLEIQKSGIASTNLVFEKDKIHMTRYETPYGELMVGVFTKNMTVDETENDIRVNVNYELDINSDKVADCDIKIHIRAKHTS